MNKKFLKIITIVSLILTLVGCGNAKENVATDEENKVVENVNTAEDELKEYLPRDFVYCSSAGDWYTIIKLNDDLTYEGHYYNFVQGMMDEDYAGALYKSEFSGEFGEIEKEEDNKYSFVLESMNVHTAQEENIVDGVLNVGVQPRGLEDSKHFELYLPDTSINDIPEIDTKIPWEPDNDYEETWNPNLFSENDTIGCFELYNKDSKFLFVGNSDENDVPCTDGVLSIVDTTNGTVHSPYCDKVKVLKPENRRIIITPHFEVDEYGYTLDIDCMWG